MNTNEKTPTIAGPQWLAQDNTAIGFTMDGAKRIVSLPTEEPGIGSIVADLISGVYGPIAAYVPPVPQTISMRQCRLQLLADKLLPKVDSIIAGMASPAKEQAEIEWEYATEVHRTGTLVTGIGAALKLDAKALDKMFISASKL